MFIDFREKERKKNERERDIDDQEASTDLLPCAPARDWTHNLLVYGMMLQPTKPPGQGSGFF